MGTHAMRSRAIGAGLALLAGSRAYRLAGNRFAGRGAILAFHRILQPQTAVFQPNRALGVALDDLSTLLQHLRDEGIDLIPLGDVSARLGQGGRRFVALTFDDGYRDNLDALPILERFAAPFTVFATTGFLDRTARLWWLELETALRDRDRVTVDGQVVPIASVERKQILFRTLRERLRVMANSEAGTIIDALAPDPPPEEPAALVDRLCLDWDELRRLARHPLATIGCHTISHPSVAALSDEAARHEAGGARAILEQRLDTQIRHFAYPYGAPADVGPRATALVAGLGFETAVTTSPGVLHAGDADRLAALPRLPVDGRWPGPAVLDTLLSGVPTRIAGSLRWLGLR